LQLLVFIFEILVFCRAKAAWEESFISLFRKVIQSQREYFLSYLPVLL
jgi:hypothetical protein